MNGIPETEFPEWLRPPYGGFTSDDLFRLTALPPHTQLIDGTLVPRARQTSFHTTTNCLLQAGLTASCPPDLRVCREMTVVLDAKQALEPDVSVVSAAAVRGPDTDRFAAGDMLLVVETVDSDSAVRDRERKPQLYARGGIPHFWRVEAEGADAHPVVYGYELDSATRTYVPTGIHHDRLKLPVPFTIDIDLTEIDRL